MKPYLTIVVPIYNTEHNEFKKCIDSLINQTYSNIEIILVDDGSTNNVIEICNEYKQKDRRIKVLSNEGIGTSAARNTGIKNAEADYIMFVDSDDWIEKETCEKLITINEDKKYDLIMFSYIKEYGNRSERVTILKENRVLDLNNIDNKKILYNMKLLGSSCMKLYRIETMDEFNIELANGEDVEFNFRTFNNIKIAIFINENLYHYRIKKSSTVRNNDEILVKNYEHTINEMQGEIDSTDISMIQGLYSFESISLLMIVLNNIFTNKNKSKYIEKKKKLKEIAANKTYDELFNNIDKVKLPVTRKLPIIFIKYNMCFLVYLVAKIKHRLNGD